MLKKFGLDWEVYKHELCGKDRPDLCTPLYGIFRADNDEYLGVSKSVWKPIQNKKLVEKVLEYADEYGYEVVDGGCLDGGKQVWLQLELKKLETVANDEINKVVTLIAGHTGKNGISVALTPVVLSCMNQFYWFYGEGMKFTHTGVGKYRLEQLPQMLKAANGANDLYESFHAMAGFGVNENHVHALIKHLTGYDFDLSPEDRALKYKTRATNIAMGLKTAIEGELSSKGWTLWGLFNGITYYYTHLYRPSLSPEKRNKVLMTGIGAKNNRKALEWCENLLS